MDILKWILDQIEKPIKMFMFRFNLDKWTCRHCQGSGVCINGYQDRYSCNTCLKEFEGENYESLFATKVKCSVCNGSGREEFYLKNQNQKLEIKKQKKNEK